MIVGWIKNKVTMTEIRKYQQICLYFLIQINVGILHKIPNPTMTNIGTSARIKVLMYSFETSVFLNMSKSLMRQSNESTEVEELVALVIGEKTCFMKLGHFRLKLKVPVITWMQFVMILKTTDVIEPRRFQMLMPINMMMQMKMSSRKPIILRIFYAGEMHFEHVLELDFSNQVPFTSIHDEHRYP